MLNYLRTIAIGAAAFFSALAAIAQEKKIQEDQFAKIGNMDVAVRTHLLKKNVPADLPEKYLPVSNDKASAFKPFELMDTQRELEAELLKMREGYKSFLENYAPSTEQTRKRIYISSRSYNSSSEN